MDLLDFLIQNFASEIERNRINATDPPYDNHEAYLVKLGMIRGLVLAKDYMEQVKVKIAQGDGFDTDDMDEDNKERNSS